MQFAFGRGRQTKEMDEEGGTNLPRVSMHH